MREDGNVYVQLLTHVGQSAGGHPVQLASGQRTIRVAGSDVSVSPADEIHGDRSTTDRLETVDYLQHRVAKTYTQIIRQPTCNRLGVVKTIDT